MSRPAYRLGIDIGGTFTDLTVLEPETGQLLHLKTPTVASDPAEGVMDGLGLLADLGLRPESVESFVHGTTTALNALLERKGAAIALFVTEGFRDLLTLQRLRLPVPYDFRSRLAPPLVPRERTFAVRERLWADGSVLQPLDLASLDAAIDGALAARVEGVAICFLHSYHNGEHERLAAARLRERAPGLLVCLSSEVWPQMREYERAVVTSVNLYVRPRTERYFRNLIDRLKRVGVPATPFVTQSNGGIATLEWAAAAPVHTLLSGPAAGVMGACRVGVQAGLRDMITFDMGGTSTDISVVEGQAPTFTAGTQLAGLPLMLPTVDIASIGAGGGSVAWLDAGGLLKVGPRSMGSDPGPACYGRGGQATLTDAFVACGLLHPRRFAGGRVAIYPELATQALGPLAEALGLEVAEAADRIVQVAIANMFAECTNVMERRGFDPRDFTMVAYGGAGPLTASFLAEEIQARGVLVPRHPGTLCAYGALTADLVHEVVRAWRSLLAPDAAAAWRSAFAELAEEARGWLAQQRAPRVEAVALHYTMDLRYRGQAYDITVPVEPAWVEAQDVAAVAEAFHGLHQRRYAHHDRQAEIEVAALGVRLVGVTPKASPPELPQARGPAVPLGERRIHYQGQVHVARVYERSALQYGHVIPGPAVVEQDDSTVLILAGWRGEVDRWGNLHLRRDGHREGR